MLFSLCIYVWLRTFTIASNFICNYLYLHGKTMFICQESNLNNTVIARSLAIYFPCT